MRIFGVLCFCLVLFLFLETQAQESSKLSLTFAREFDFVPINEQDLSVVVSVVAPAAGGGSGRAPVSISAVLDRSGSMRGNKISLLKSSTEFLVSRLEIGDYLGVVSYSSSATEDVPLTAITATNSGSFNEAIGSINARGSTNLADGLFDGLDQQVDADIAGTVVKSVILFTDGLANTGVTDIGTITSTITSRLRGNRPPTVYALGFGGDHDRRFLQAIAEAGNGVYVFVSDANAIPSAIGEIFGGLLTTTAQDIKVTLTPRNGARIVNVRGGTVSSDLTMTTFPDLFAEERRDILVDLRIPVLNNALERQEVLQATLEYFNTISEEQETETIIIAVDRTLDVVAADAAPLVEKTRLRFRVADDIEQAVNQKEAGDTEGATATLDGTLSALNDSSESDSEEVKALANDVEQTRDEVDTEDALSTASSNRLAAGAASVSSQRAAGTGGVGFASLSATSAQESVAQDAVSFTSG